jgi:hypothetical protein
MYAQKVREMLESARQLSKFDSEEKKYTLEALAVNDGRSALVVFLLGDPHLLEGRERCQDRTTDPDGVLSLGWGNDLDLHGRWCKSCDFLLHTVGDTWIHGRSTGLWRSVRTVQIEIRRSALTMTMLP